ncbi:MAG: Slp family lipoprotein [Wenzhouxiangellaceae bacterium]|nr:Slp family lipoprotein [Wenzhouxiangellaceae bacterium]
MKAFFSLMFAAAMLTACATSPFNTSGRDIAPVDPGQALVRPGSIGATVIWGGRVVGVVNTPEQTELEVLSLPLGFGDRPRREADGGARFVVRHPGFLEPMTYSPGRYITAMGRFSGVESRSVGAFPVDHPVLDSQQLELWPVDTNSSRTNLHLGAGFRF